MSCWYKSERSEAGLNAKPVALRDHNGYSVILGHFYNAGYDQHVTLAQVFYITESRGQPEHFYVVADAALSITEHFAHFGSDLGNLRKRLRELPGVALESSFAAYGAAFRRRFGIADEQAPELFSQTVSMKSVGNLTDFVREHMLEEFPVEERIQARIQHFDDLNRAHEAVLKAKQQIALLGPLVANCDRHALESAEAACLAACREALTPWFAGLKAELLDRRLGNLAQDLERQREQQRGLQERQQQGQARRDELNRAIARNGGDRLAGIKEEIARLDSDLQRRQRAAEPFLANRQALPALSEDCRKQRDAAQNQQTESAVELRGLRQQHDQLDAELASLRSRRSNLPARILDIRARLCQALELDEGELPFVGELLQVRDDERDWEGVAERLLHNFGLSLLVPDALQWVERTHLGKRLVYFRVRERRGRASLDSHPDSLVRKLQIKPETPFYDWLEGELARRFDYACCASLERSTGSRRRCATKTEKTANETSADPGRA
ncbi:ATP-binding protein [Stutzerimonas kirkiae]|uniref:ATP-binding protein n=1 Tax=Stutzerimonas kirkiae TaxID=2211392 RepID=UPI001F617877|nr:hypothetical protein [Stutzerimonas kirkiae]